MSFAPHSVIKCCALLAIFTAVCGMALPNSTRQIQFSDAGTTFGSAQLTPFLQAEGINTQSRPNGMFAVNRLQLLQNRNSPITPGFYAIQLTRAASSSRFPAVVFTPRNSDATVNFLSVNNTIRIRLRVQSSFNRATFVYEGTVSAPPTSSLTISALRINQIDSIDFDSAEETNVGGTFRTVQIARRTTTPQSSAVLFRIQSQAVPLSTRPPSPLASNFLPGRDPIYAADGNLFRSFGSRVEPNPYLTISTVSSSERIELISLTSADQSTFLSSGVRVFVGDCVLEPPQGPSQIVRYLNEPGSASELRSCSGSVGLRRAFECEPVQQIRGFSRERVEFYCGASRQSWGFLYVTTARGDGAGRQLGINEIVASRNV